jgi:L-ribulose-5-phosphate 3-epimerase UlaE
MIISLNYLLGIFFKRLITSWLKIWNGKMCYFQLRLNIHILIQFWNALEMEIQKGLSTIVNLHTLTCFHLTNNVIVKWFPTRIKFVLMIIKVSINVPKLTRLWNDIKACWIEHLMEKKTLVKIRIKSLKRIMWINLW